MARITVEDCFSNVPNRFELVLLAAQRARQHCTGAQPTVPLDRDKPTVVALREFAAGSISTDPLRESLIARMRRSAATEPEDVPEDDAFHIDRMAQTFTAPPGMAHGRGQAPDGAATNDGGEAPDPGDGASDTGGWPRSFRSAGQFERFS